MSNVLALGSFVVSAAALGIAYRSDRRAAASQALVEQEHRQRQADRAARSALRLAIEPSNVRVSPDGVIVTGATTQYVNLAIRVLNDGAKAAGRTDLDVWVPSAISATTLKWFDPAMGDDNRFGTAAPDPAVSLPTGDGRLSDAQRMVRVLDGVPLIGETVYLRLACPVRGGADSAVPVRVRARTDDSETELTYVVRLRHTLTPA